MDASSLARARAVLFDLDGTLLDTLEDLGRSTNTVLAREKLPLHTLPSYKQFVGEGITMLVRRSVPKEASGDEALVGRLVSALKKEYAAHCTDATHVYGGVSELLAKLSEKGIATAVLSNKPDDMVQRLLKHYLFSVSFDAVMGAGDSFPRKPDPSGALDIAQRLRILPEDFIFLGDSKTDMETATAAGMYPVGALWGFRGADELLAYGAKALIKHPSELIALLNR
jgi:phosphoglycolate phosphatase